MGVILQRGPLSKLFLTIASTFFLFFSNDSVAIDYFGAEGYKPNNKNSYYDRQKNKNNNKNLNDNLSKDKNFFLAHNFYYQSYTSFFDINGKEKPQRVFTQMLYKPYLEYHPNDKSFFAISPAFQTASSLDFKQDKDRNTDFAFVEATYVRNYLEFGDYPFNLSFKGLVDIPGFYDEEDTPTFGSKDEFIELGLVLSRNFYSKYFRLSTFDFCGIREQKLYVETDLRFRSRIEDFYGDDSGLSFKADVILGYEADEDLELFFKLFHTEDMGESFNRFNILNRYGYDLTKIQFSVVKDVYKYKLELGFLLDINGENTGKGEGVIFSIWQEF